MKTICALNGKVIMMQDGAQLASMQNNASQIPDAVAGVVTDEEYLALIAPSPSEAKVAAIEKVKELRRSSLDKFVKNSPGISRVYAENYFAATELQAGRPDTMMVSGATATAYLLSIGQNFSMTAAQFATYIINENRGTVGLAIKVSEIEAEYVRLVYAAMPTMTAEQVEQAVIDYTAFCAARVP